MESNEKKVKYFPFHAINEFMRNDYRQEVVRITLHRLASLPGSYSAPIERLTRKVVKVPGFRNSAKAPVGVRVKPTISAFEKNPDLAAAILSAWSELHRELRGKVYALLNSRGWEVLPPEANRTKLPGFLTTWPEDENFERLTKAFKDEYPEEQVGEDDISLMVVWLSGRLPYQMEVDDDHS